MLHLLTLDALKAAVRQGNPRLSEFEASCFDGKYITGDVTADYLSHLAEERDAARGEIDGDAEPRETVAAGESRVPSLTLKVKLSLPLKLAPGV